MKHLRFIPTRVSHLPVCSSPAHSEGNTQDRLGLKRPEHRAERTTGHVRFLSKLGMQVLLEDGGRIEAVTLTTGPSDSVSIRSRLGRSCAHTKPELSQLQPAPGSPVRSLPGEQWIWKTSKQKKLRSGTAPQLAVLYRWLCEVRPGACRSRSALWAHQAQVTSYRE